MELPAIFSKLLQRYTSDHASINELWQEIEKRYTNRKRHYHNLTHLEKLVAVLPNNDQRP